MTKTPSKKIKKQVATALQLTEGDDGSLRLQCPGKADECQELHDTLGTVDNKVIFLFLNQILKAIDPDHKDKAESLNRVMPLFRAIKPTDELEGMLAVQMIGVHSMATEMMGRAMRSDQIDHVNSGINRVTKLTRTFIAQMEALDKHRGKGQQKMTVEHVHVNEGGQAVIGNVERGEGKNEK